MTVSHIYTASRTVGQTLEAEAAGMLTSPNLAYTLGST